MRTAPGPGRSEVFVGTVSTSMEEGGKSKDAAFV